MTAERKTARLSLLFLLITAIFSAEARAGTTSPLVSAPDRVRILDYENDSAESLLFLELDKAASGVLDKKPAWQSLNRESAEDRTALADDTASGAYDIVITGDEEFVKDLENRGALLKKSPIFKSELILLGPPGGSDKDFAGGKAAEIMKQVFSAKKLFFTSMNHAWLTAQETALWREAGVPDPGANVNYVESGREGLSLLLRVEEEGGYTLAATGTFAQYLTSTREPDPLVKLAGSGIYRTYYLCLIDHKGFRATRGRNAEKLAAWFSGENAAKIVADFSLAEIKPFVPVRGNGGSP